MNKQVRLRIEESLGASTAIEIEAEVSESPHKEPETHIRIRLNLGEGEKVVSFDTERHNLENLYRSLNELLIEIPLPRTLPF